MIVRDEEKWIGRCLASVKDAVDEMIVVDTGSTDRTADICRSFGASVHPFPWNGSFADARNESLKHATGDWILWLDADEEADALSAARLRDVLEWQEDSLGFVQLVNYYGASPPESNRSFLLAHHRLFRNGIGFRFGNTIHEQLNVVEVLGDVPRMCLLPVSVYHYGYMDAVTADKNKFDRNLALLLKEKEQPDCSPWVDYHIASEYYRIADYRQSFEYVNKSIVQFLNRSQMPPSLLYKLKYSVLFALNSHEGAWPGIESAIKLYPDYVDLHFYKGVILFRKEKYSEALEAFKQCLELGESNLRHLTLKGLGSFQAWYYIGRCLEKSSDISNALQAYRETRALDPAHKEAAEALAAIEDAAT
ncbi:glycosyltransferase [Cohnella faecalis]|uniref:Glycosyltransferase n=2 Tax=Cohnella faecalis TaxID=2315694 RepID=A0A398CLA9_9BACL|nr:glycosyltransferase [Cohnella faecalis]